ncbi:MAG: hypothetical protein H7Y88_12105 [Phycisphaerales bacterium]|nr:hypothetical protein [Phycisphaerales bacterium]
MSVQRCVVVLGLFAVDVLGGCASDLPVYPAMSDAEALATIADRQGLVRSISAECDLDLTDAQGQRVRLEGVLVAEPPGKMRLRAWKLGHAVFDLTLADGKAWVIVPSEGPGADRLDTAKIPAWRVSEAIDLLGPAYFRTARRSGGDKRTLLARGPAFGQDDVVCEIERLTLTPRRFIVGSDRTSLASELLLDDYTLVGNLVWPMHIRLRGASGEMLIRIHELELNGDVPAGAFIPPSRAKALP